MAFRMHPVKVWSGEIDDRPGAAAAKLERLAVAGVDLEFVFTRPKKNNPDQSVLFLAPITGPEQEEVARTAGLGPDANVAMLCVEGENRAGIGYHLMSSLAVAGLNLRGLSISSLGDRFAAYLAFDNLDVAKQAQQVLADLA